MTIPNPSSIVCSPINPRSMSVLRDLIDKVVSKGMVVSVSQSLMCRSRWTVTIGTERVTGSLPMVMGLLQGLYIGYNRGRAYSAEEKGALLDELTIISKGKVRR